MECPFLGRGLFKVSLHTTSVLKNRIFASVETSGVFISAAKRQPFIAAARLWWLTDVKAYMNTGGVSVVGVGPDRLP